MRAIDKDTFRSIKGSLGRFLAIAGIVALGVGFYAGLRMTYPDMNLAADVFYDATELMDLRVASTLGLSDDDISALRNTEGVESVMPAYEMDVMGTVNNEQYAIRIHSLPESAAQSDTSDGVHALSDDAHYLNRLILKEGRWPEAAGECIISADRVMNEPTHLGDTIHIIEGTLDVGENLATDTYTIVGYASSPYYVCSSSMGTTTLGGGVVQQFMYILESDFSRDMPYSEAFIAVKGAKDYAHGTDEYYACVDEVRARIDAMAPDRAAQRTAEVKAEAQAELDDATAEAYRELSQAGETLETAATSIAQGEAELVQAQGEYASGVVELSEKRAELAASFAEMRAALSARQSELEGMLVVACVQLDYAKTAESQARAYLETLLPDDPGYAEAKEAYETAKAYRMQAESAVSQLESALASITEGFKELARLEEEANQNLAAAQDKLDEAAALIADAVAELESGRSSYSSGLAEYNDSLAEVEAEIADAQQQIDDIEAAEWFVLDRTKNYGVESFKMDATRVDHIASVFPFIFFLVAALVALTTMTRMVEEERVLIGTYKALGYSKARITGKYLFYAAAASVLGCIVGLAVLPKVLPAVIMVAYSIIYSVPRAGLPLEPSITILSAGLGIGITLIATWAAVSTTLREKPASLMLPRAPKAGKRIFLERIKPVWSRMSFSWKVTFRNLFLYKKRLFMTVVGIAGCTALLLTGFGLRDAINDIIDLQFGNIIKYNTVVSIEEDISDTDRAKLDSALGDTSRVAEYTWAGAETLLISPDDRSDLTLELVAPSNSDEMSAFITWQERKSGEPVELTDEGALISEKVSTLMGVGVGDTLRVYEQDSTGMITDTYYDVPIAGVVENYVANYMYITPAFYEKTFGTPVSLTKVYANILGGEDERNEFSAVMRSIDGVKTVAYNDETIDAYRTMLKSVDLIVWVLIFSAAALAFIVLYNLININICERVREIATLKVLGFLPREVSAYIYRETLLLSILGAIVGLVLGIFLESFVVTTAEVDQVMFGRMIHATSFLFSFLLTILFTVFVMLVMHRKLRNVNMVESLKSIE